MDDKTLLDELAKVTALLLDGALTKDEHSDKVVILLVEQKRIAA